MLKPDGMLLIAVPDMAILARLILDPTLSVNERFFVIKMIYGAQSDSWDYHMVGFDQSILTVLLQQVFLSNTLPALIYFPSSVEFIL